MSKKERLTILVGAGASTLLKIPGTVAITKEIFCNSYKLFDSRELEFLEILKQLTTNCYRDDFPNEYKVTPGEKNKQVELINFEHLIHTLETLSTLHRSYPSKNSGLRYHGIVAVEGFLTKEFHKEIADFLSELSSGEPESPSQNIEWFIRRLISKIIHQVLDSIYQNSRKVLNSVQQLPIDISQAHSRYRSFLETLASKFQLNIVTLNYDPCIEEVISYIDCGFRPIEDRFIFSPSLFMEADERPRLAHLHGSINIWPFNENRSFFPKGS